MAIERRYRHGIGGDDPLGLLARTARRSPLQELRDYPFFAPDGDRPAPARTIPHGGAWLALLALILCVETVALALLVH